MGSRSPALLLILVGVGGLLGAFALGRQAFQSEPTLPEVGSAPAVSTRPVLIARDDIPAGNAILASQVEVFEVPLANALPGTFRAPSQIEGRVLRTSLRRGEMIQEFALSEVGVPPGIVARIREGYLAMAVRVDPVTGVAGFVQPDARVDVLATLQGAARGAQTFTSVILQNVRVLAIGQKTEQSRDGSPELVTVITLEVSPTDAPRLGFATARGEIQLALRVPGDAVGPTPLSVDPDDLIVRPQRAPARTAPVTRARRAPSPTIEAIRGTNVRQEAVGSP